MKLGTETGSVVNHVMSRATRGQPEPVVGMGATICSWTDRHGGTITTVTKTTKSIKKEKITFTVVGVKRDNAKVVKGTTMDGTAEYEYTPNDKAHEAFWGFINGRWISLYQNNKGTFFIYKNGEGLAIGYRDEYYDPCF